MTSKPFNLVRVGGWFRAAAFALGVLFVAAPSYGSEFVYRLSPFDKVSISVYGEPDLATEQLITDEGAVFLPLLGAVNIEGKTVAEASKQIENAFVDQKYLRKPVVTISIEEFAPKVVTVLGEVNDPGTIELARGTSGTTIQMAVAQAGGFKNTAKTNAVVITRAKASAAGSKSQVVDVDDMISKSREGDVPLLLKAGDVVFVPRRVF
jgi:polysaccharide export outer membrane protein